MATIIEGDLLAADADIVVQQCNCLTITSQGLSNAIKQHCGVDPYGHRCRMPGRGNCAIKADRGQPGTVRIYPIVRPNSKSPTAQQRPLYVACLFAQFSPSKPGYFYRDIINEHSIKDDAPQRIEWFKQCLQQLTIEVTRLQCKTVAFPYQIGCGLAGGNWTLYLQIINEWAADNKDKFTVAIYHKS